MLTDRKTYNRTYKLYKQDITLTKKHTSACIIWPLCWMDILCKVLYTRTFCFRWSDFDLRHTCLWASPRVNTSSPPIAWSQSVTESLPCHACVVCSVNFVFFLPPFSTVVAGISDLRSSSFQSAERSCTNTNNTKGLQVVVEKPRSWYSSGCLLFILFFVQ